MVPFPTSVYATWRANALQVSFLQETRQGVPSERLLQLAWQHQRIRTEGLATADGRVLRILHPGFWNHSRGPDFRDAVIRIGPDPPQRGDVEIDLRLGDWVGHRHADNPDYAGVILHVVWHAPPDPCPSPPVLVLQDRLDTTIEDLIAWVDLDPGLPDNVIGRCASPLRSLSDCAVADWLTQGALFRFQRKAVELAARARQVGWRQSLWEGLCGGLGYQHNVWPMRRLAEHARAILEHQPSPDLTRVQALLLGSSGLLPADSRRPRGPTHAYLRSLWDVWWREQDALADLTFPPSLWRMGGLRPANHPQRRVALAAHWLLRDDLFRGLEDWLARPCPARHLTSSLLAVLQAGADPFWSSHWTLTSGPAPQPRPLLGATRASDLATNVILPWFWIRAETGQNPILQQEAVSRYLAWPAAQDNAVLRLARLRLFAGEDRRLNGTAALQQGMLQVVRDFCGHSNALCDNCVLPERLKECRSSAQDPACR